MPFWQKREAAAPWPRLQLSSARPGFPRYELRSRGSRPGLRWTYPIAKAHDCAPGRRRPRPSHHLEVTRSFSANVCCACAYVQASRLGFPGDRLKYQWLIRLNRSATKTKSKFPACRVICSGALARSPRRCKILVDHFSLATAGQLASSATGPQLGCWRRLRRRPRLSYCHDRIRVPHSKPLCTYVSPFDVSLQESVTSELNYLVARGRQACPMVCAPPPTLSVTHAFPHLALSAPPAAYLHGFSTLTLISCHPAVQGAAERRLSRGKGAPDHVRGGSACRRLIRMAPES